MKILLFLMLIQQSPMTETEALEPEGLEVETPKRDLRALDQDLLVQRMRLLYGEIGRRGSSSWKVDVAGETLTWTWSDGQWSCETAAEPSGSSGSSKAKSLNCRDFTPHSLRWWETNRRWLDSWQRLERQNFVLDQDRPPQAKSLQAEVFGELILQERTETGEPIENLFGDSVDSGHEDFNEDEPFRLAGRRLALEEWRLIKNNGEEFRVFTSLRNNWIERIDHAGQREYIVAERANSWSPPRVNKIILERSGLRLTMERQAS